MSVKIKDLVLVTLAGLALLGLMFLHSRSEAPATEPNREAQPMVTMAEEWDPWAEQREEAARREARIASLPECDVLSERLAKAVVALERADGRLDWIAENWLQTVQAGKEISTIQEMQRQDAVEQHARAESAHSRAKNNHAFKGCPS